VPCWEYAYDEEGEKGQDECTVRPLATELSQTKAQVFVQAVFFFPNGRIRFGSVTLNAGEGPSGHQPTIFLQDDSLNFYNGSFTPKPSETKQFVTKLKKVSPTPFPIRYVSALLSCDGTPLAVGILEGLYWMADWRKGEINVVS
jgi:hypothetical protein